MDVDKLQELEFRLVEAMKKGDVEVLDELLADELIFTMHTGHTIGKYDDIQAHKNGIVKIDTIKYHDPKTQIYPDLMVVSVIMEIEGFFNGEAFKGKNKFLRVWKLTKRGWQIIVGQSTAIEE